MANYRYIAFEPRSGTQVGELPLYGTSVDKQFKGIGNFQGTLRLGTGFFDDVALLSRTRPGRYAVAILRNDIDVVWAGIIWTRTYASDAQTMSITAQSFESIFGKILQRVDYWNLTGAEESVLWTNFLNNIQTQDDANLTALYGTSNHWNFNITLAGASAGASTQVVDYLAAEWHTYQDVIEQLAGGRWGYTFNYGLGVGDAITKTLQLVPNTTTYDTIPHSGLYLDFPGNVNAYWLTENANQGGIGFVGRATSLAPGSAIPSVKVGAYSMVGVDGYTLWETAEDISDTWSDADLTLRTNQKFAERLIPQHNLVFEMNLRDDFTGWGSLGKRLTINFYNDPRWQDTTNGWYQQYTSTIESWALTPPETGQVERLRFTLGSTI